jgi:hypothetical protein
MHSGTPRMEAVSARRRYSLARAFGMSSSLITPRCCADGLNREHLTQVVQFIGSEPLGVMTPPAAELDAGKEGVA